MTTRNVLLLATALPWALTLSACDTDDAGFGRDCDASAHDDTDPENDPDTDPAPSEPSAADPHAGSMPTSCPAPIDIDLRDHAPADLAAALAEQAPELAAQLPADLEKLGDFAGLGGALDDCVQPTDAYLLTSSPSTATTWVFAHDASGRPTSVFSIHAADEDNVDVSSHWPRQEHARSVDGITETTISQTTASHLSELGMAFDVTMVENPDVCGDDTTTTGLKCWGAMGAAVGVCAAAAGGGCASVVACVPGLAACGGTYILAVCACDPEYAEECS